jgi:hypothetical protein
MRLAMSAARMSTASRPLAEDDDGGVGRNGGVRLRAAADPPLGALKCVVERHTGRRDFLRGCTSAE